MSPTTPRWRRDAAEDRWRRRLAEPDARPGTVLGVGASVIAGIRHLELASWRLRRRSLGVVRAASAASTTAVGAGSALPAPPEAVPAPVADPVAGTDRSTGWIDVRAPIVPVRYVLALEIVIVAFEWSFWNATWSRELARSLPWYAPDRLAVALLALVTPLLGVVGAQMAGGALHRVLKRYPDVGRFERLGAVCGLALATGAVVAIAALAHWRFTDGAGLGSVEVPPAAMTAVFVLVIVLDVVLRTFGTSEDATQRRRVERAAARRRRTAARRDAAVNRHLRRWEVRWHTLRLDVVRLLARVDLIGVTGDQLVIEAGGGRLTVADAVPGLAGASGPRLRLPSGRRQPVLAGEHQARFEVRLVEVVIALLDEYRPPGPDHGPLVADLRARLLRVAAPERPVDDEARVTALRARLHVEPVTSPLAHREPA